MNITFFDYKKDNKKLRATIEILRESSVTLKQNVEDLKLTRKIFEEDIKHMVRIKEEKNELEFQDKVVKLEGEQAAVIAKVKDKYRDKVEKRLKEAFENMEKMYGQILERLPEEIE